MNSMSDVLLMFSGGKDSFLTACKLAENGHNVKILVFNSGCIAGEENALVTAQRLVRKYGKHIEVLGIRTSMATRILIDRPWKTMSMEELSKYYPNVTGIQSQCFFCQTSMWIEAIAYCVAKDIKYIACGYKSSDKFCTGSEYYMDILANICSDYNLEMKTPMWSFVDTENGIDIRDEEMHRRRFIPSVLEPKCTVGLPVKQKISDEEMLELIRYFNEHVDYKNLINKSSKVLKYIRITDKSLE